MRIGYESEAITNTGGVTILNARALKVGIISRNNTDNTWWIDDPQAESKLSMAWGNNRTQKIKICSEYLPAEIRETVWPLIDSNLWIAVVVVGETPGRTDERNQNQAKEFKATHPIKNIAPENNGMDICELPQPNLRCI